MGMKIFMQKHLSYVSINIQAIVIRTGQPARPPSSPSFIHSIRIIFRLCWLRTSAAAAAAAALEGYEVRGTIFLFHFLKIIFLFNNPGKRENLIKNIPTMRLN